VQVLTMLISEQHPGRSDLGLRELTIFRAQPVHVRLVLTVQYKEHVQVLTMLISEQQPGRSDLGLAGRMY
jgi:hypothetical protein